MRQGVALSIVAVLLVTFGTVFASYKISKVDIDEQQQQDTQKTDIFQNFFGKKDSENEFTWTSVSDWNFSEREYSENEFSYEFDEEDQEEQEEEYLQQQQINSDSFEFEFEL